jgi:hypothetical protein
MVVPIWYQGLCLYGAPLLHKHPLLFLHKGGTVLFGTKVYGAKLSSCRRSQYVIEFEVATLQLFFDKSHIPIVVA